MPRVWNRDTFIAGQLESGIYNSNISTNFGFPFSGDATIIVFRPAVTYLQAALIFDSTSNDGTPHIYASNFRSTGWRAWKEL